MLESMRNHTQGWIAKVILGAIILSFALWGIGDYFTGNKVEAVAEIDGEAIFDVDFSQTYQRQLANYANMLGEQFNKELAERLGVKNETLQTMINRKLMLMEASEMGLVTPDEAVLATVQTTPQFIVEGTGFSAARYQALIRQMGFSAPRDYENYLRQNIMIETLQNGISSSAVVSDEEVKARFKSKFEKRVLEAFMVDPENLKKDIEVTDAEARDWYDDHESLYQSPLKIEVQIVEINKKNILKNSVVDESDIEEMYSERESEFTTSEKRRASAILVGLTPGSSDEIKNIAQVKIQKAKKRIEAGEAFADVAKDVSDDVTSSQGGDLGFFTRGSMVAELDSTLFDKLKVGDVSDVVDTERGLYLVKLNAIQPEKIQSLAKVKDKIRTQLLNEKAAEEAYRLSGDLDNALGMEDSLQAAAKVVDLPVEDLGALSQENILANPLFSSSKELQKKAFSTQPGDAIEIIEVEDGHFVALAVQKRIEPETMAFEDVVNGVYEDLRSDAAIQKAKAITAKALAEALAGKSIDDLVQEFGQAKLISKPVRSNGEGDDASWLSSVLEKAFRSPESSWVAQEIPTSEGFALVFVKDVQVADVSLFADEEKMLRSDAKKAKGAVRFASWMASVRDRHQVDIHKRVLNRF
ncbi:MAG: SurA N-terminal domain-containing protein [Ghiorsea sp.]